MPTVYTPEEVAAILKVHVNTVYRLLRGRKLPAAKLGRDWRIPADALDDYLHGRLPGQDNNAGDRAKPWPEDAAWLEADLGGSLPPYDWGPAGPPKGRSVQYVPGRGLIVERKQYD